MKFNRSVPSGGDNRTVTNDHGANGHFTARFCTAGLLERLLHEGVRHRVPFEIVLFFQLMSRMLA